MYKFPSGFYVFLLLLFLALVVSLPAHGQEITISETTWNGIKLQYAQLKTANESLQGSLDSSVSIITELKISSAELWLELNGTKNELVALNRKLKTAETQAKLLGEQLTLSDNSLNTAIGTMRKEKIKTALISGGIGVVVGGIVIGLIIGLAK